jgi:hypothetical protein
MPEILIVLEKEKNNLFYRKGVKCLSLKVGTHPGMNPSKHLQEDIKNKFASEDINDFGKKKI